MNMRSIIVNILKKFQFKDTAKPLGRWHIEYCKDKINRKIELSNEDHCGSCGQYINNKLSILEVNKQKFTP